MTATAIRSSVPVPRWSPSAIILLGDAIHAMTPARGTGANTALRDAALLTRLLPAAARGEQPVLEVIGEYEAQMTEYGFAAVRASLAELKRQTSMDSRAGLAVTRTALCLLDAVPPLKRRVFADLSE
ncbi:FAD-dependent oxidoreductase [Nonomuraea sp. NPDC049028]|uniref:FAD-dependent oxidoreductase n=1 Tax=Nonomuraea sp. NPDC049028 TaxID=3364348 RepID=UPI003713052D